MRLDDRTGGGGLTICGEQEMRIVVGGAPLDSIDLLFNLETFQIIKLWFVALKLSEELIFTWSIFALWAKKKTYILSKAEKKFVFF